MKTHTGIMSALSSQQFPFSSIFFYYSFFDLWQLPHAKHQFAPMKFKGRSELLFSQEDILMKILKVQIKYPDNVPNQHLIPGLYRSNLASCPLGKPSFIYPVICLFHKYLLSIHYIPGIVWALGAQW